MDEDYLIEAPADKQKLLEELSKSFEGVKVTGEINVSVLSSSKSADKKLSIGLEEDFDRITVEQAFDRCGGVGKFQMFSCIMNTLANAAAMFLFNAFAFLEVEPMFMCKLTPGSDEWTYGNTGNNHLET